MTELHLSLEHLGAGATHPRNNGLGDLLGAKQLDHTVLGVTADLTEQNDHLDLRDMLIAEDMVGKGAAGEHITTDGHTFEETISGARENVVQLVAESTALAHDTHRARSIELAVDHVIDGAGSVGDLEGASLDATHCGRTDHHLVQRTCLGDEHSCVRLRNSLGDDHHRTNGGQLERRQRGAEGTTKARKVDKHISVRMRLGSRLDGHIHRQQELLSSEEGLVLAGGTSGGDQSSDRWSRTTTNVVKVEHALNRIGLRVVEDGLSLTREEHGRSLGHRSARRTCRVCHLERNWVVRFGVC
mmetsp:Transcript_10202/g.25618  ORF Transcript_10202/g.25618 Transcript_10202/m.25618 type:complete len:300 (+) Transcript_10202:1153-2052(+)